MERQQQLLELIQAQTPGIHVFWENALDPSGKNVVLVAIDVADASKRATMRLKREVLDHPVDAIAEEVADWVKHYLGHAARPKSS